MLGQGRGKEPRSGTGSSWFPFRMISKWMWAPDELPLEPERPMTGLPWRIWPLRVRISERWA